MVARESLSQIAAAGEFTVGKTTGREQAGSEAAPPRAGEALVDVTGRAITVFQ
jgi:hypothetical protein